jgi:hypothetical protein
MCDKCVTMTYVTDTRNRRFWQSEIENWEIPALWASDLPLWRFLL